MYIKSTLGLRGLYSSRTPLEHDAQPLACGHPTLEITALRCFLVNAKRKLA